MKLLNGFPQLRTDFVDAYDYKTDKQLRRDCDSGIYPPRSGLPVDGSNATENHLLKVKIIGARTYLVVELPLTAPQPGKIYDIVRVLG